MRGWTGGNWGQGGGLLLFRRGETDRLADGDEGEGDDVVVAIDRDAGLFEDGCAY